MLAGDRCDDALHRPFGVGTELHVVDAAALDAHQVVMMVLEGLGELVPGDPVPSMVRRRHPGVGEHGEGAVDGGEGDRVVEVLADLGGRDGAAAPGEGSDDIPAAGGESDVGAPQAVRDLLGELRDDPFPPTLMAAY